MPTRLRTAGRTWMGCGSHGAMVVSGPYRDAEAYLLRRIQDIVGPEYIVSASMDLYRNVSRKLAYICNLLLYYWTALYTYYIKFPLAASG